MESRLETFLPILAALVAAGCSSPPSLPPTRPNEVMACEGLSDKLLAGLTTSPSRPVPDYFEVREDTASSPTGPHVTILAKRGTPCATAADKAACETELRSIHSREGFAVRAVDGDLPTSATYLVTTSKDQIEVFRSMDDVRALLAPIDTPADVEMIAGCGRALRTAGGWELTRTVSTGGGCNYTVRGWERVSVSEAGVIEPSEQHVITKNATCFSGRRPAGLVAHPARPRDVGTFLAECAHLESASVAAFEQLAAELTALGASDELVARARRSRDDEVRHARTMERLAAAHGVVPRDARLAPFQARSMRDIALENAVEGCVRETFGALLAHYQATVAADEDVRAAMRVIADDETRHAGLAWDVAAWLEPQLAPYAREEIEAARRAAWREISFPDALDAAARHALGLPDARAHAELHAGLAQMLEA